MERPYRLDPELAAINVMIPRFDLANLEDARAIELELVSNGLPEIPEVAIGDFALTVSDELQLAIRSYSPLKHDGLLPALLYIHGGGFMLGGLHTEEERCQLYAARAHCVVVQVDYRLAPENPFPAAFNDVMATLAWISEQADALGIDTRRIAVGGNSAGGAIAASVALACRAPELPDLVLQLLVNPALDCSGNTQSANEFVDSPVFKAPDNVLMWQYYLGGSTEEPDFRASPSLAGDVRGAASAVFWFAEYDPLRDEGYEYALRLMHSGTPVGIYQYPGTFHGFDSYRMTRLGRRALDDQVTALRHAFA